MHAPSGDCSIYIGGCARSRTAKKATKHTDHLSWGLIESGCACWIASSLSAYSYYTVANVPLLVVIFLLHVFVRAGGWS
jgi:hypothetical protein